MSTNKKLYSIEFKKAAAALILDQNYTYSEACTAVNIGETALRRWAKQLNDERKGITPLSKAMTPEQQRIKELEARIKKIEWENDIIKKATALLISGSIKS